MSVDETNGLLYLPTTSASPDFWGGARKGNGKFADSVVALHIADGSIAWSFQRRITMFGITICQRSRHWPRSRIAGQNGARAAAADQAGASLHP